MNNPVQPTSYGLVNAHGQYLAGFTPRPGGLVGHLWTTDAAKAWRYDNKLSADISAGKHNEVDVDNRPVRVVVLEWGRFPTL
jgi:hypothetical protein